MLDRKEFLEVKKICLKLFTLQLELEKETNKDLSVMEDATEKLMEMLKKK